MRIFIVIISVLAVLMSCKTSDSKGKKESNVHEVEVLEAFESGGYTYLRVKEDKSEHWLATSVIEAKVGDKFYYEGGMVVEDFESETLGKTFESIIFVDKISKDPNIFEKTPGAEKSSVDIMAHHHASKLKMAKKEINIEPVEGGITIAELYANKKSYKGKKVLIKGQVTKFNDSIMHTNWIHIQDGTEHEGKFDLTATSDDRANVGDIIILEGRISLDKDFGHGYTYETLMEKAKIK